MTDYKSLEQLKFDDKRWSAFLASTPQADNIFYHPAWTNLIATCYNYTPAILVLVDTEGKIAAGLPILTIDSPLTGKRWVSLPFTDHCAPLYREPQALERMTEELAAWFKEGQTPTIELRWPYPACPDLQTWTGDVLHTITLNPDIDVAARQIHAMHKRNIRVAERKSVEIEWGREKRHMDSFYRLHLATRKRQGIPVQPRKFFDLLKEHLIDQGLGFILLAKKDERALAAALFLHWRQTLTYKYGASNKEGQALRANNLIFWTAIRWGCENGYTTLDMGKTDIKNTGLRTFKSRWGAQEVPLTYSILSSSGVHARDGLTMQLMQTFIKNTPLWVCRTLGECLYRHFG